MEGLCLRKILIPVFFFLEMKLMCKIVQCFPKCNYSAQIIFTLSKIVLDRVFGEIFKTQPSCQLGSILHSECFCLVRAETAGCGYISGSA
jgi:hypothetical protein